MGKPRNLLLTILIGYAYEQHESGSDLLRFEGGVYGTQFVDDVNAGLAHSLHYYFHKPHLTARSVSPWYRPASVELFAVELLAHQNHSADRPCLMFVSVCCASMPRVAQRPKPANR